MLKIIHLAIHSITLIGLKKKLNFQTFGYLKNRRTAKVVVDQSAEHGGRLYSSKQP